MTKMFFPLFSERLPTSRAASEPMLSEPKKIAARSAQLAAAVVRQ